jgi:hypothetical protein
MELFEEKFLEIITREYFPSATPDRKLIFQLRFEPKFHPKNEIKPCNNKEIASMVKKQLVPTSNKMHALPINAIPEVTSLVALLYR